MKHTGSPQIASDSQCEQYELSVNFISKGDFLCMSQRSKSVGDCVCGGGEGGGGGMQ